MRRILKQILIFVLIAAILFTNINISRAAGTVRNNDFYQMKSEQESTMIEEKDYSEEDSTQNNNTEDKAEEITEEYLGEEEKTTEIEKGEEKENSTEVERKVEEDVTESRNTEKKEEIKQNNKTIQESTAKKGSTSQEASTESEEDLDKESKRTEAENITEGIDKQENIDKSQEEAEYSVLTVRPDTNHSVTMPDITSHYFLLQKNSKKISAASGSNLVVVANAQAASKYIYESYPNGKQYNFTPRFSSKTVVKVGGGTGGGVSLATVKKGEPKQYGDVYTEVTKGRIASKVFNLEKCTVNPYAVYSNVGTWYDYGSKRTYAIDVKVTVTGYKFPGAAVRKQLANKQLKAPYVGFAKSKIGLTVMGTDYVQTRFEFYYNGTTTPVSGIKGMMQVCDIDAQQGVDFGTGFEKIVVFNTAKSKLQYNKNGLITGSKGYVSSRTSEDLTSNNEHTTAMGIFSGSKVDCRWTVAKCDQKDTGGNAAYSVKSGYGIPADSTIENSTSYYWSNSTGFLAVRADVGIAPLPEEIIKTIYSGNINGQNSEKKDKVLGLTERTEVFSYVLSAVAPTPSNINNAKYTLFQFEDSIEALLKVRNVRVYADEAVSNNAQTQGVNYSDMTSYFTITKKEEADHKTTVQVKALDTRLTKAAFYGRTYYVHIEVEVKSDQELHKINRSITDWYQQDTSMEQKVHEAGSCKGTVAVSNMGKLLVKNNKGSTADKKSNDVVSKISMKLRIKKLDEVSGKPVKGVVFGFFGGNATTPLYTAVTDDNGIATFKSAPSYTFYKEAFGHGPYYVKEISIPEIYKNVWNPSVNKGWYYKLETLKNEALFDNSANISESRTLKNKNYEAKEHFIKVYKKSKDTGAYLSGAQFVLSEWSAATGKYKELLTLTESKDKSGHTIYQNEKKFQNTMDNLGRYKITEKKAPKGCILTGQEWSFELSENNKEDGSNVIFQNISTGKRQTGELIYRNPLQKAKIVITKKNDEGQLVKGAEFSVKAAEDIYAPWDLDNNGKPIKDAEPLISKGTIADKIITKDDGKGESNNGSELYIGKYIIEETKGAINHIKGDSVYELELNYGVDEKKPFVIYYVDASNRLMRPSLAIAKIADKTTNEEGKEVTFNKNTGRYTEKKQTGIYEVGEVVDYTIRVTNTGNVPLYQIRLTDDMDGKGEVVDQTLSKYADMETATFIVPDSGTITTQKGDKVSVKLSSESDLEVILQHLNVKDSLDIHVKVRLKEDAKDAWKLRNDVYGEAKYNNNTENLVNVPVDTLIDGEGNSLVRDWDFINIPGNPGEKVIKTADKTTGIVIENGEIKSGIKVPGSYNAKEKVKFSIIVKNNGEAALKNITIKDEMSEELKKMSDEKETGFAFDDTVTVENDVYLLTTADGKTVTAKVIDKDTVMLCSTGKDGDGTDRLFAGDYITLNYEVQLLPGMANIYNVSNKVYINSWYFNGNEDLEVPGDEDEDKIEIPGIPEGRSAKLADKTTGVVLEEGRYNAKAKISGIYENGNTVTYKITVTNKGTANLYNLYLKDTLSEALENALEKNSVSFEERTYTSQNGRKVRTSLEKPQVLWMDFLSAEDSVDVFLKGKVRLDVGNLFALENIVELTASYKKGNEEAYEKYKEKIERENQTWKLYYDANNDSGEVETDSETPCQEGKSISLNGNAFLYEGYYFVEWNTKADGSGEKWKPGVTYIMPANDVKLYAQWRKEKQPEEDEENTTHTDDRKNPVYNLIYHSNNANNQLEADEENSKLEGSSVTVNENHFLYSGYTFMGWNTRADGKGKTYTPGSPVSIQSKDMMLYAQWKKNTVFQLVYDANNASGMKRIDAQTPCEVGTIIQIDGNSYHYEQGKDLYTFTGWNTRPDGQGQSYKPGEKKEINANVVLYAQWKKQPDNVADVVKYHIFYRANNNTTAFSVDAQTPEIEGKSIILEKNQFSYVNHIFTGWNTRADGKGKHYNEGVSFIIPDRDISLYAQWKEIESPILTYSSNTKGGESVIDAENTIEKTVDGNYFHNNGFAFIGWNTSQDGKGKTYVPSEKITLKENTVLYAQWSKDVKRYRLMYHSNYPANTDSPKENQKEIDSETPAYAGTKIKINKNYFSYNDYVFKGWSTQKEGNVEYISGQWYVMPQQDVDLYACWEKIKKEDAAKPKEDEKEDKENESGENNKKEESESNKDVLSEETQKAIQEAYDEIQKLTLKEIKQECKGYTEIPVTELMRDTDNINIPGTPIVKVAKKADKTQGVTLIKGRYEGEKKEGIYEYGDNVEYTIDVTNAGTADLYDLLIEDCIDSSLFNYLNVDSIRIPSGEITTKMGNKAQIERITEKEDKDGKYVVQVDVIKAGDSMQLHIQGQIKQGVPANTGLNNIVHIAAQYETVNDNGKKERTYVLDTPEMTDNDTVGIGVPEITISKKADKTKNIILENGRYVGKREYGTYKAGEKIKFKITVSNRGNVTARNIKVTEEPSEELRKYVKIKGFVYKVGDIISTKQRQVIKIQELNNKQISIDKIEAGDSVELLYIAKVRKDIPSIKFLKNEVSIQGENKDGSKIALTPQMRDYDKINLKEKKIVENKPVKKQPRLNVKSRGTKTGDNNNFILWILLSMLTLTVAVAIIYHKEKSKKR